MMELIGTGTPSFEIRGRAGDLDRSMWSRPTDGPIERRGDVTEFEAIISPGIQ